MTIQEFKKRGEMVVRATNGINNQMGNPEFEFFGGALVEDNETEMPQDKDHQIIRVYLFTPKGKYYFYCDGHVIDKLTDREIALMAFGNLIAQQQMKEVI